MYIGVRVKNGQELKIESLMIELMHGADPARARMRARGRDWHSWLEHQLKINRSKLEVWVVLFCQRHITVRAKPLVIISLR